MMWTKLVTRWPWLGSWRTKMYTSIAILIAMAVVPMVNIYVIRNDWWSAAWGFITLPVGWYTGRLFAEASKQRTKEELDMRVRRKHELMAQQRERQHVKQP